MSVPAGFRELITVRSRIYGAPGETVDDRSLMMDVHPDGDRLFAVDVIGQRKLDADLNDSVSELPAADRGAALAKVRRRLGGLVAVGFDGAGRMVLPPMMRDFGGIGARALFWGVGDSFEIWDAEAARAAFAGLDARKLEYLLAQRGTGE